MKSNLSELVNGLPLPPSLLEAIHTGRWLAPSIEKLEAAFPLAVNADEPIQHPVFFDLEGMQRENDGWSQEILPSYVGQTDGKAQPGDINPVLSVVIGDLGPDRLIALDYRPSDEKPRVVYLTDNDGPRWVEAAPDIETLLCRLSL